MAAESIINPILFVHVLVFGLAAVACFVSIYPARELEDPDTRRGLVALLATSGGWAAAHVLFLVAPRPVFQIAAYQLGLILGFAAIGAWLYFCSAYTGRSLHHNPTIRGIAVAVFVGVIAVKLSNPWHGLYFSTTVVQTPFPHLAVRNGLFHWLAMGLAYALAAVGYFMLLELFMQVSYGTKPLVALIAVTGLPVLLDVIGLTSPYLVEFTYEPLGVAVFAVGIFYVYRHRFQAVQLAAGRDEPVVVLSDDNHIRDFNQSASELFPGRLTREGIGRPLADVVPEVAEAIDAETSIIELDRNQTTRYYRLTHNPFGAGRTRIGGLLTLTDITHRERYRRELERQNERLEQFANMVSHDLRNPLNVADGHLDLARREYDSDHLESVRVALDRMEVLIDDLLALARQGQPIDETEPVVLSAVVDRCWQLVDTHEANLVIEGDLTFRADGDRLQQLLENLFRNAIDHGGKDVAITVGTLDDRRGFYVADDGPGIPPSDRTAVFESGVTTAEHGTGFGLAIVEEIVDAHGWSIAIEAGEAGGARFEITGVERTE